MCVAHDVPRLYPPSAGRKGKDNVHVLERRNIRPGEKDRSRSFPLLSFEAVSLPNPQVACSESSKKEFRVFPL